jgi:8-amino-7-oxononanoate synthase
MDDREDSSERIAEISEWLTRRVAEAVRIPVGSIDAERDLVEYGLDSATGLALVADLEDFLGCQLPDTLLLDFRTIAAIAKESTARERRHGGP